VTQEYVEEGAFEQSRWDVVAGASIGVRQELGPGGYPGRSASLWYVRLPGQADYRWLEVPYMAVGGYVSEVNPFALAELPEADFAASNVVARFQHAAEPVLIDDEHFEAFAERWMGRLALAATSRLQRPRVLPE
jgi:hypothetical protein